MKTRAVILAGGEGSRLSVLTVKRAKPAVPFAGKYRIIDFTLSNCVNSGIHDVMILAQYRPHSLIEHIGAGGPWDLNRDFTGGVRMYMPYKGRSHSDWYLGTADAVQQNFSFVKQVKPDHVLILSGDHVYAMDYDALITFHRDHQADLTMATIQVAIEDAHRFGIVEVGEDYRVTSFVEKPKRPPSELANMGVYVFNIDVLDQVLLEDHRRSDSNHDFGKNIIPRMVAEGMRVFAYPYSGYWVDVGTIESYWQAHMDLLADPAPFNLNDRGWVIHTRTEERSPVRIAKGAVIEDSMICDGCVIEAGARVQCSILSPGVIVHSGAIVSESILLTDTVVEAGARVFRTVTDKRVHIGLKARVGSLKTDTKLALIGKNSRVPPRTVVEPGATISTDVIESDFPGQLIKKDLVLRTKRLPHEI